MKQLDAITHLDYQRALKAAEIGDEDKFVEAVNIATGAVHTVESAGAWMALFGAFAAYQIELAREMARESIPYATLLMVEFAPKIGLLELEEQAEADRLMAARDELMENTLREAGARIGLQ